MLMLLHAVLNPLHTVHAAAAAAAAPLLMLILCYRAFTDIE